MSGANSSYAPLLPTGILPAFITSGMCSPLAEQAGEVPQGIAPNHQQVRESLPSIITAPPMFVRQSVLIAVLPRDLRSQSRHTFLHVMPLSLHAPPRIDTVSAQRWLGEALVGMFANRIEAKNGNHAFLGASLLNHDRQSNCATTPVMVPPAPIGASRVRLT